MSNYPVVSILNMLSICLHQKEYISFPATALDNAGNKSTYKPRQKRKPSTNKQSMRLKHRSMVIQDTKTGP